MKEGVYSASLQSAGVFLKSCARWNRFENQVWVANKGNRKNRPLSISVSWNIFSKTTRWSCTRILLLWKLSKSYNSALFQLPEGANIRVLSVNPWDFQKSAFCFTLFGRETSAQNVGMIGPSECEKINYGHWIIHEAEVETKKAAKLITYNCFITIYKAVYIIIYVIFASWKR